MEKVVQIAETINRPPVQVALNWLRQKPGVVIPIFSARTVEQAKEDVGCVEWNLSPEQMRKLNEVTEPALTSTIVKWGYPNDFLQFGSPAISTFEVKKMQYGNVGKFIDNHRSLEQPQQIPGPKVL